MDFTPEHPPERIAAAPDSVPVGEPAARFLDLNTPPHIVTLVLVAGIGALNMNAILPSLPSMAAWFGTDYSVMQLAVSAYIAVTAGLQLIVGPLSDRYGRRPVLITAISIFLLATVAAALAQTIEAFLAARLVQAVVVGGFVLSRAIVRDMVPMERAASMIGYVTMGMTLVPMIGPMLGGFLQEMFGWQSVFWMTAAAGLVVLAVVILDLKETNHHRSANMTSQFRAYPELFTSRRFWGFVFSAMFASGMFFAFIGGAPYVAQHHLGLSPSALGMYFVFIVIGYMTGNFLSGRYAARAGVFNMMIVGAIAGTAGIIISLCFAALGIKDASGFFGPLFLMGMGNGMVLPSANAGMISVRPHLAGSAAGLGGAIQIGGGAALSVLSGHLLTPQSGPTPLLLLMLAAGTLGIVLTLYTRSIDRQMAQQGTQK